jgi:hypothetical protein
MSEELHDAFQHWREECEIIAKEMERVVGAGLAIFSDEARQMRRTQFTALVERRNAAASRLLAARRVSAKFKPAV